MRSLYFDPVSFFFLPCFPRLISAVADWMYTIYFYTWCGPSANLECRSENVLHAARCKYRTQKIAISAPSYNLSGHIFATKALSTIGKNLLSINTSSTCPDNMVNFGLLTAEICWRVWGTPTNFNGFCVLAALLHGI